MLVISRYGGSRPTRRMASRIKRMLDFVDAVHLFQLRVLQQIPRGEAAVDRDVDVLVDRRRDHETAVLAVVRGQIGAAAGQRNSQRASRDNHGAFSCRCAVLAVQTPGQRDGPPQTFVHVDVFELREPAQQMHADRSEILPHDRARSGHNSGRRPDRRIRSGRRRWRSRLRCEGCRRGPGRGSSAPVRLACPRGRSRRPAGRLTSAISDEVPGRTMFGLKKPM